MTLSRTNTLNQRSLLAKYDAQIEEIEGEIASLEKEQASIKKLIAQQAKALGSAPGMLARPVPGAISSGFGRHVSTRFTATP